MLEPRPGPMRPDPPPEEAETQLDRTLDTVEQAAAHHGYQLNCTLRPNSDVFIARANVRYFEPICDIEYNPSEFAELALKGRQETIATILGHEMGHVIMAMECGSCTVPKMAELDADRMGGCLLATAGGSEADAEAAASYFGEFVESDTHPNGSVREIAVLAGFQQCLEATNGVNSNG